MSLPFRVSDLLKYTHRDTERHSVVAHDDGVDVDVFVFSDHRGHEERIDAITLLCLVLSDSGI